MTREEMKNVVKQAFLKYSLLESDIVKGFIKEEHIKLVINELSLKKLSDEELSEMWEASYDYFNSLYCEFDESGEIVGFKPFSREVEFARDTQSAWSEVINQEARNRRVENNK